MFGQVALVQHEEFVPIRVLLKMRRGRCISIDNVQPQVSFLQGTLGACNSLALDLVCRLLLEKKKKKVLMLPGYEPDFLSVVSVLSVAYLKLSNSAVTFLYIDPE